MYVPRNETYVHCIYMYFSTHELTHTATHTQCNNTHIATTRTHCNTHTATFRLDSRTHKRCNTLQHTACIHMYIHDMYTCTVYYIRNMYIMRYVYNYRALLQKRRMILRSLLIAATPHISIVDSACLYTCI